MWILIRWLRQKPADLDLQCFQNRINLDSAGQGLNREWCNYQGCLLISISKFPDFSLTFDSFPDPLLKVNIGILIYRRFENFVQIFILADLIFKGQSQTMNIRKGMFLIISCLQVWEYKIFRCLLTFWIF